MKAMTYARYGSPDVLALQEIDTPVPKDDEVLISVRAASVNPRDWHILRGLPYISRPQLWKWRTGVLGSDVAGYVEDVGRDVTLVGPGNEVFADVLTGGFPNTRAWLRGTWR
jgi:NADPH:quinone reductase-like Zn-dependent oxidoreductase